MISIIIPIFNEERVLLRNKDYFVQLSYYSELIFVDGGSDDESVSIASQFGKVIQTKKGRSNQKNGGVGVATNDLVLFLNVDTKLSKNAMKSLMKVSIDGFSIGCFSISIEDNKFFFRLCECVLNFRSKYFGVVDGDLGCLVRTKDFERLGGFKEMDVMEDIDLSCRLSSEGKAKVLSDKIYVSSRRWYQEGFLATLKRYMYAYWCYYCR